ncbi:MAG: guanylate kinase [Xanthomonadales bacterium]|nr:guanylate kinase [Xanthomonadales bacterium]
MSERKLFVVAAPSGGGKTSLVAALLERDDRTRLSVSHTTRAARPGEKDGEHYHFVNEAGFLALAEDGAFLEHARVFDHRYGTGRAAVEKLLAAGFDVILDIDWQGARQIRRSFPGCVTIFIVPPSLEILQQRLARRGQDSEATIRRRMRDARAEISHWDEFDHVVINDDFEEALEDLHAIVREGGPRRSIDPDRQRLILAELLETG